jgi:putative MATE family efflux protein
MVSCAANIILDILLVAVFGLGVMGVAVATGIAMFMSWIFSVYYIRKRYPELELSLLPRGIVRSELKEIISIGLPIGLNNSLFSFGHLAMQALVNTQGSVFMAGWSVSGRVNGLANMAIAGLSSAATTFSGQNFGAGRIDRLREGRIKIPMFSGIITFSFGMIFLALRMPILRLFTEDARVLMYAGKFVAVMMFSQWMYAVFNGISCIVNGTGRVRYTTVIKMMMRWAVRIPSAYLISRFISGKLIMYSFPISFGFGMLCMIGYYRFCPSWRKLIRSENKNAKGKATLRVLKA